MINKKINCIQYSSILLAFLVNCYLGSGIDSIIKTSKIDSYLTIIIGFIIGIIILYMFLTIFNYQPDLPIKDKLIKLYGKTLGNIFTYLLTIIALITAISLAFNLNNFLNSQFLTETPIIIIGLFFSLISLYIVNLGIDLISRTSLILTFIIMILFTIAVLSLIPTLSIDNLKPFLINGLTSPIKGSFYVITLIIAPIFLMLSIPKNDLIDKEKSNKYIKITYLVCGIIIFLITILIIGNLGINLTSYYQYPEYMVLKRINLFNFINRIENIIIIQWVFGGFISYVLTIYYISNNIKQNNKLLNSIIILIVLILSSLLFRNNTRYINFNYYIMPYIRLIVLIIMIITTIIIKRKKSLK